jgi:transcriptional accessory protein Tex/SPT6
MDLQTLLTLLTILVAIAGNIAAIIQHLRAARYKTALDLTDDTLNSVIAGVEVFSRDPRHTFHARALKRQIEQIATATGTEHSKLADAVQQVAASLPADADITTTIAADAVFLCRAENNRAQAPDA